MSLWKLWKDLKLKAKMAHINGVKLNKRGENLIQYFDKKFNLLAFTHNSVKCQNKRKNFLLLNVGD